MTFTRAKLLRLWKTPAYQKRQEKSRHEHMTDLWRNPKFRSKTSKAASKSMKKRLRGMWRSRRYRKFQSSLMAERWKDTSFISKMQARFKAFPSKAQVSLFKRICRAGLRGFRLEYPIGRYSLDIANPKKKIAIEIDGSYWHRLRRHGAKVRRTRFLNEQGWTIRRFNSSDLERAFQWVLSVF